MELIHTEKMKSICLDRHGTIFEQDLVQLVEQLKQFVFLDIYAEIDDEKVECYHHMIQERFPNSYFSIDESRFRFWI